jgi:hypothetical protein
MTVVCAVFRSRNACPVLVRRYCSLFQEQSFPPQRTKQHNTRDSIVLGFFFVAGTERGFGRRCSGKDFIKHVVWNGFDVFAWLQFRRLHQNVTTRDFWWGFGCFRFSGCLRVTASSRLGQSLLRNIAATCSVGCNFVGCSKTSQHAIFWWGFCWGLSVLWVSLQQCQGEMSCVGSAALCFHRAIPALFHHLAHGFLPVFLCSPASRCLGPFFSTGAPHHTVRHCCSVSHHQVISRQRKNATTRDFWCGFFVLAP